MPRSMRLHLSAFRRVPWLALTVPAALALGACVDAATTSSTSDELYGAVTYNSTCTAAHQAVVDDGLRMGRAAGSTVAFEQCLDRRMNERYRKCIGDPFYNSDLITQKQKLLAITRNLADVSMPRHDVAVHPELLARLVAPGGKTRECHRWKWASTRPVTTF